MLLQLIQLCELIEDKKNHRHSSELGAHAGNPELYTFTVLNEFLVVTKERTLLFLSYFLRKQRKGFSGLFFIGFVNVCGVS